MDGAAAAGLATAGLSLAAAYVTFKGQSWNGTTLVAPRRWLVATLLAMAAFHGLDGWAQFNEVTRDALRFFVACMTYCPLMAVLGAKRPQHRGWQFVVLALWCALSQPALEAWAFGQQNHLQLHSVRQTFMLVLVFVGVANYVATRFCGAAVMYAAGQLLWFGPFTTLNSFLPEANVWGGSFMIVGAVLIASSGWPRRQPTASGWSMAWLDFRDAYGAAWGLRCQERWNAAARRLQWETKLGWSGFDNPTVLEPDTAAPQRSFRMLLRRFVSADWLRFRTEEIESSTPRPL